MYYDCLLHFLTLWLWYSQLMIKQSLSLLVMWMLITLSGWSLSLQLIGTGVMLLIFAICRVVSCWFTVPLTLLVTDSILWWRISLTWWRISLLVGTPLGTSDHCFVSCVFRVEQSVSEYNIRSTVFVKSALEKSVDFWHTILKIFLNSGCPIVNCTRDLGYLSTSRRLHSTVTHTHHHSSLSPHSLVRHNICWHCLQFTTPHCSIIPKHHSHYSHTPSPLLITLTTFTHTHHCSSSHHHLIHACNFFMTSYVCTGIYHQLG